MGLESANYIFQANENVKRGLELTKGISQVTETKFVYTKENQFWIDLELQNNNCLSIRIALCNPKDMVIAAFENLLENLFGLKNAKLLDMKSKRVLKAYNVDAKNNLVETFNKQKKLFESIYGDFTASISSEEFYRRIQSD